MIGFGSSTVYKMVVKSDGSPNWPGIVTLITILVVMFIWRCCVFVPEYWVATRRRFNRVVRTKDGMPKEYDPLAENPKRPGKQVRSFRFRFYLINSLVLVNCGKRETNLDIDAITIGDVDFDTSFSAAWNVSRAPGNPTKSFLKPADSRWKWRSEKDELEQLVRKYVADAVLRAYELINGTAAEAPGQLPLLDFETDSHLQQAREFLLDEYGVEFTGLLYGRRSMSPARRLLQGQTLIAESNREIAHALRGEPALPVPDKERAAAAAVAGTDGNVVSVSFPSPPSA